MTKSLFWVHESGIVGVAMGFVGVQSVAAIAPSREHVLSIVVVYGVV